MSNANDANRADIEQFYDFLNHGEYGVTEVMVKYPDGSTKIGYFNNKEDFVRTCMAENGKGLIYASVNPCPREFLSKAPNHLRRLPHRIGAEDVEWVTTIPIDVDPKREPADIASTQEEMDLAISEAREIVRYLEEHGLCEPGQAIIVMSGNGAHILLPIPPIQVTNDNREEVTARKRAFEQEIRDRCRDNRISIGSIHDLPRIIKVIGTKSVKGQDTTDRPHRVSRPITDMDRHESSALRDYIMGLDVVAPSRRPSRPAPILKEMPTDLVMDSPCPMCPAARRLWSGEGVEVGKRSDAEYAMMQVLVAKGLSREEAIAYMQKYDRNLHEPKYTTRPDGGVRELSSMYDRISSATRQVRVPCRWLQKNGYCDIDISECDDPDRVGHRYRPVRVSPEEVERDTIPLPKARKKLGEEVGGIRRETGPRTHLIVYPGGTGKTHQMAEHVRRKGWKTLWLCATHDQAKEAIDKHFKGARVCYLRSRKQMIKDGVLDCPHASTINRLSEQELDPSHLCGRCYKNWNDECSYYKTRDEAEEADIIVGMHDHLEVPEYLKSYMDKVDCVVINEDFSQHYSTGQPFTRGDVEVAIEVLEEMTGDESIGQDKRDKATELMGYCQGFLSRDESSLTLHDLPDVDDEFMKLYNRKFWEKRQSRIYSDISHGIEAILNDLPSIHIKDALGILRYASQMGSTIIRKDNSYTYVRRAELPTDKNVVILDATGIKEFYEAFLGRGVSVYGDTCYIDQVAQVTQFLDGAYFRSSLLTDSGKRDKAYYKVRNLIEVIKEKHPGARIVIGTMKKVQEKLRENGVEDDRTDIIHYRQQRGIDQYKDHDVLIVVGIPMLSYEDIAKGAREMFNQNWDDEEMAREMRKDSKKYKKARYSEDGMGYEIETYQFSNEHVQKYYEHVVLAELVQMIGRIRPYEGDIKHVYIISNTPIETLKVDELVTIDEFEGREGIIKERRRELQEIKMAIDQRMPDRFKVKKLGEETGRTSKNQRDHLRDVLRENQAYFGIHMEPGKHHITKIRRSE